MLLRADTQRIELDVTDPGWCRCWLYDGANRIYLGAETSRYIQSHLLDGLENNPEKIAGIINGEEVYWILSLEEAHHTLYCTVSNEDKILFWQDKYAKIISEIKLPAEKVNEWIDQLKALNDNTIDSA